MIYATNIVFNSTDNGCFHHHSFFAEEALKGSSSHIALVKASFTDEQHQEGEEIHSAQHEAMAKMWTQEEGRIWDHMNQESVIMLL